MVTTPFLRLGWGGGGCDLHLHLTEGGTQAPWQQGAIRQTAPQTGRRKCSVFVHAWHSDMWCSKRCISLENQADR